MHPDFNDGARMLRRGYNFVDGTNPLGGLDAGLFFIAFVRDPDTHFIPIQNTMAKSDALMEYLKVTGSALFAVPPGIAPGGVRRSVALRLSGPTASAARCAKQRRRLVVPLVRRCRGRSSPIRRITACDGVVVECR